MLAFVLDVVAVVVGLMIYDFAAQYYSRGHLK